MVAGDRQGAQNRYVVRPVYLDSKARARLYMVYDTHNIKYDRDLEGNVKVIPNYTLKGYNHAIDDLRKWFESQTVHRHEWRVTPPAFAKEETLEAYIMAAHILN